MHQRVMGQIVGTLELATSPSADPCFNIISLGSRSNAQNASLVVLRLTGASQEFACHHVDQVEYVFARLS